MRSSHDTKSRITKQGPNMKPQTIGPTINNKLIIAEPLSCPDPTPLLRYEILYQTV